MTFDDDLNACAALVERGDPDRFLATMAAPVAARRVLFPLFALNVEVARAPWVTQEPIIAEMRLQWWRDALAEIAEGGPVRRHEIATPLSQVLSPDLAKEMDEYIAVRRWDIYKDPFENTAHFDRYIDRSSACLLMVAAQSLGAARSETLCDFGYASGVANLLRAAPELVRLGRVPLLDGTHDGISALAARALDRLARARAHRRSVSADARPALLSGWQTHTVLTQAFRDPARVGDGRLGTSEARRRISLMWQAATGRW
ncbi:MAG: squalene/phytoene synthase family protein [Pseudomonadota bacterium]